MKAEEWLERAKKDLDDAKFNLEGGRFEVSAFLAHQAAEKALKALYVLKFGRLWKIHDLVQLAKQVGAPHEVVDVCDKLNPHYIATRYLVETVYTAERSREALELADKVIEWVEKQLQK
jgi:HEPN domain-containing protein